jgi:signal transduction histidine kinase
MIAIPLIALLVGCLCITVFIIQLWTIYRKEKAQEERLRWLEHEHMVLEQKVYELRQDKLKKKEIEKGIVEILTDNQKQIETLEKQLELTSVLLSSTLEKTKSLKTDLNDLRTIAKDVTTKDSYRKHIIDKYTATRRATTSPYVTTPTAEDTTIEANTIHEIIKRLNQG